MAGQTEISRYIPKDIRTAVRQRCRFGCVICGTPVTHFDHIEDFADVQEHTEDNLTLLCPTHHQDKSSRRLPRETVRKANANPYNGRKDFSKEHRLFFEGDDCTFVIGGNTFQAQLRDGDDFRAIQMSSETLAGFRREHDTLLLNFVVRDAMLNPLALIKDGELIISTGIVDFSMIGPNLFLQPKFSIKPLQIKFCENGAQIDSGFFFGWGQTIEVNPDAIISRPGGNRMSGCRSSGGRTGFVLRGPFG